MIRNWILSGISCLIAASCAPTTHTKIVDLSPARQKWKKLVLWEPRGMVGLSYTSDNGTRRQHQNLMKRGMLSKSGILRNWGQPERISKTGGVVTMEFHSRKWEMNPPPPGPVVLKFSGDRLTYVEAWFEDNGRYRSPTYIIP